MLSAHAKLYFQASDLGPTIVPPHAYRRQILKMKQYTLYRRHRDLTAVPFAGGWHFYAYLRLGAFMENGILRAMIAVG